MSIETALHLAIDRLLSGRLENEAQVKQSVILPVLRALDWDDTDPKSFKPEYRVDGGFVDYALLEDEVRPLVFIEAKRMGNLDISGEAQLFGYANNKGVPFLILTDGNRWDFYLSMAAGIPSERRFYRMELQIEGKISEYTSFLETHLRRDRVVSGEAKLSAEKRHTSNWERERVRKAIPRAWQSLFKEPDEKLRDLLAETVERECGGEPDLDDVEAFLKNTKNTTSTPAPLARESKPTSSGQESPSKQRKPQASKTRIIGFILGEESVEAGTARGTLAEIITRFDRMNPKFMESFSLRTVGRTRRLVARSRGDLYDVSHLTNRHAMQLANGWWLGTNLSQSSVLRHIKTACGVAGIKFDSQLKIIER